MQALCDEALQSSLADLHGALDLETFWDTSLDVLAQLLPHSSCSLMLDIVDYRPRAARHNVVETSDASYVPATSLEVSKPFLVVHPLVKLYTYSQIVSEDPAAAQRRLAQEAEPGEWAEFIHLAFWHRQRPEAVLSIRRRFDQPPFSESELNVMHRLYPTIAGALQRMRVVEAERATCRGLQDFLQHSAAAIMVFSADGELLFATPAASSTCARWQQGCKASALAAQAAELPPDIARLLRLAVRQSKCAADAAHGDVTTWHLRHATIPGWSASIHLSESQPGLSSRDCYLISFACSGDPPERGEPRSAAAGAALLRLTPCERKVALLVAEGLRNEQVAKRLHRSRHTIEFQLHSIYRKLDVACRSQLVRVLS